MWWIPVISCVMTAGAYPNATGRATPAPPPAGPPGAGLPGPPRRRGRLAFVDRADTQRLALLCRQVVQRQTPEHVVHERGREPHVRAVRHPGWLELHVDG